MTPGILNLQKIKSDFNSKMLNFNMGLTMQLLNMFGKLKNIFNAIKVNSHLRRAMCVDQCFD